MKKTTLKDIYRQAIKDNPELMGRIAQVQGKSFKTIERQIQTNHPLLAADVVLREIYRFMAIRKSMVLTDPMEMSDTTKDA